MSMDEFTDAQDSNMGYCSQCKEFTNDCCEPDARQYECEACGNLTVYGAEEALLMGLILIEEDQ